MLYTGGGTMDIQVQELLETIKKDGVEAAEQKAKEIISAAEEKAKAIVADGERKVQAKMKEQEQAAAQLQASGKAALAQAGRDLVLSVEKQLQSIFEQLVVATVKETYKDKILEDAIASVVSAWTSTNQVGAILLSEAQEKQVASALKGKIGQALSSGVVVKTSPRVSGGFLIQEKNGAAYYDFTVEAVAQALSIYVNPMLADILADVK
jgi:V/A-type H+-transporting ATPase subunit E